MPVGQGAIHAEMQVRRTAVARIAREREHLPALNAVAERDAHAATLEVEVLARRAIGVQNDDEVREPAALLAQAAAVVRILEQHDHAVACRVHARAHRHAEVERELLRRPGGSTSHRTPG